MNESFRWDPCVAHIGCDAEKFLSSYFGLPDRSILLVAGVGFDPRSCSVATKIWSVAPEAHALLIREKRPNPPQTQLARAEANRQTFVRTITEPAMVSVDIFGPDGAVVGGRNIVNVLGQQQYLGGVTDIVVDITGLSMGTSFPIVRYFVEYIGHCSSAVNLHVFVVHSPKLDAGIQSIASDVPSYVHGFKGGSTLTANANAAKLWLPQLATKRHAAFGRLYDFIGPHDTCPILPFPAGEPRLGDVLMEEYLTEFESTWSVDSRNIVYANEDDPQDLYRTILKLDNLRKPVFAETGGSMLFLSPLGNKAMALGALMAALERDLPVAYLEPIGYEIEETTSMDTNGTNLIHIWLEGDVYPLSRPVLSAKRGAAR